MCRTFIVSTRPFAPDFFRQIRRIIRQDSALRRDQARPIDQEDRAITDCLAFGKRNGTRSQVARKTDQLQRAGSVHQGNGRSHERLNPLVGSSSQRAS
jgi:hypothetical protein